MKPTSLYIGVPVFDRPEAEFYEGLIELLRTCPIPVQKDVLSGDAAITRARNRIAGRFLESTCSHLLFLDSDLVFCPESIWPILENDSSVVGGLYPCKQLGPTRFIVNREDNKPVQPHTGLHEVRHTGTGIMLIARETFVRLREWKEGYEYYDPESNIWDWDYFWMGVHDYGDRGGKTYLSEDWHFCHNVKEAGMKVYCDTMVIAGHIGRVIFPIMEPPK